jgi:hypothetical protein
MSKQYVTLLHFVMPLLSLIGIAAIVGIIYLVFGEANITAEALAFGFIGALAPVGVIVYFLFCAVFRIKVSTGKGTEKIDEEGQRQKKDNENGQKRDSKIRT